MKLSEKAIFISFYEDMDVLCQEVFREMNVDIPTLFFPKNMPQQYGMNLISEKIEQGISLVLCRGVLGNEIRRTFHIPVLEVKPSSSDLLRLLLPYVNSNCTLGVLEDESLCKQVREIADLLELKMRYYPVKCVDDFWTGYKELEQAGVEVIIGGNWGQLWPDEVHIKYVTVEYSKKQYEIP